jgi:hypothetical protein
MLLSAPVHAKQRCLRKTLTSQTASAPLSLRNNVKYSLGCMGWRYIYAQYFPMDC